MSYEGVSLETGALSEDGLSPADAMPMILETPNELPGYAREIQLLRQA